MVDKCMYNYVKLGCCCCYVRDVMLKVSEENEIDVWGFEVVVKCWLDWKHCMDLESIEYMIVMCVCKVMKFSVQALVNGS